MKELAALGKTSAREKLAAKRRAKQQARQALKQKEKATERSSLLYHIHLPEQHSVNISMSIYSIAGEVLSW